MTDRGLPIVDGAPACPFVAFEEDRDGRATAPDHRHRCFAEPRPAPRALAHQEAYCLSSAFPVCPTFQDWARREAAKARQPAADAPEAEEMPPASRQPPPREPDAGHGFETGTPPPIPARRNPPREWAAPPPWAVDQEEAPADAAQPYASERDARRVVEAAAWGAAAQGLAGSAADRLAGPDDDEPLPAHPERGGGPVPPPAGGVPPAGEAYGAEYDTRHEEQVPPPARRAPAPRSAPARQRPPQDPSDLFGPAWERPRRYEAYPSLRTRVGLPGLGAPSGLGIAAIALVLAAIALFFVGPMLLGIGPDDGGPGGGTPAPQVGASATPLPTLPPEPTPKVYIVAKNDTMSKIARRHGVTVEELLAANPEIKNPNRITIGQQITIPVPSEEDPGDATAPAEVP